MRTRLVLAPAVAGFLGILMAACASSGGGGGSGQGGASTSSGGTSGGAPSNGGTPASGGTTAALGGSPAMGGTTTAMGGATTMGGATSQSGGSSASGAAGASSGGSSAGGATGAMGGTAAGGGSGTAGAGGTSGSAGASGGGGAAGGSAGGAAATEGPCDIYAAGETPCVAAYSTVRRLSSKYTGPLYQVRKGGEKTGSGGTTQDIGTDSAGFADGAAQDAFCGNDACRVSKLYDQSGKGNDLTVAKKGCYTGTAMEDDYESNAKGRSLTVSGRKVYALFMNPHEGYRNNNGTGIPTGSASQGLYLVADGKRIGSACCWDFGNASKDNCNKGTMNALYFGTGYWGKGAGNGPWFMADFEGGVWAGGKGDSKAVNDNLPSSNVDYAFGILKTSSSNYAIRVGNAQSGTLTTAYDGDLPKSLSHPGGIILGIGGDNSNSSLGTFFEGAMTAGRPSDATEAAVLKNVQDANYGK